MNTKPTKAERIHLARVKSLPCSVCDHPAPSDAHHIDQDCAYTCIALCPDCHRPGKNGWHGEKAMWRIHKMDEIKALNITIKRLMEK